MSDGITDMMIEQEGKLPLHGVMPRSLAAENGAKGLLIGEFFEEIQIHNEAYCGCGECDFCNEFPDEPEYIIQKVPVSWDTIKAIYAKIVSYYGA